MATTPEDQDLQEVLRELPPDLRAEVEDFARFLLERRRRGRKHLSLDWAGALSDLRDEYTSLELQKRSLEWWGD